MLSDTLHHAQQIFSRLFPEGLPHLDILDNPFCPELSRLLILYPTDVCLPTDSQFACLQRLMKDLGEAEFFFTNSLILLEDIPDSHFFLLPRDISHEELESLPFFPVTVLFSKEGTWALAVSDEEYAIIATVEEAAEALNRCFYPHRKDWQTFPENIADASFGRFDPVQRENVIKVARKILTSITEKP